MFSITDWLNSPDRWWNRKKPAPQPPPDPDPVLPAKVISIQWGKDQQQTVTLYMPARRASERVALVLMFHGGGWWQGDPDAPNVVDAKKALFNPEGIAFATGGYRLGTKSTPKIDPYMEAQDVAALCAYLHQNGKDLGLDMSRFVVLAHSAGAHLAGLGFTALGVEANGFGGLDSAVYNVPKGMKGPHPADPFDIAFGSDPVFWAKCDPYGNMKSAPPPMLLACSTDRRENKPQADEFARKAIGLGGQAEVIEVDLEHGEMNSMLGRTDTPIAADYTAKVMAFVRKCIGS